MELEVFRGAETFIRNHRPKIFVEVDNRNSPGFNEWLAKSGYTIVDRFKRYPSNENFLIVAAES